MIPSYFPPVYRSFKRTRNSRFMLRLSQPPLTRRHKRCNHITLRYAQASRLSGLSRQLGKTHTQFSFSFFKKSWLFLGRSFTLDTSSLGVLRLAGPASISSFTTGGASRDIQTFIPIYIPRLVGRTRIVGSGGCIARAERPTPVPHVFEDATKYCMSSSVGNWFFLKRRIARLLRPRQTIILGYGNKRFLTERDIFYPRADTVRVFRSLVFCSFHFCREQRMKQLVSHAGILSLLGGFNRATLKKNPKLVLSFSTRNLLGARSVTSTKLRLIKRGRLLSRKRHRVRYRIIMKHLVRLKRRLYRNRNTMRRTLRKLESLVFIGRAAKIRSLEKYNVPRFFTFSYAARAPKSLQRSHSKKLVFSTTGNSFIRNCFACTHSSSFSSSPDHAWFSKEYALLCFFNSPLFFKTFFYKLGLSRNAGDAPSNSLLLHLFHRELSFTPATNLVPYVPLHSVLKKRVLASQANTFLGRAVLPWAHNSLIRFTEDCSGKRVLLQVYSFITQNVDGAFLTLYRRWMPRMRYYEQRLGHKFFLGEALSIIHLSFIMHDPKLLISWFSAMIQRISFWKTRLIFRFFRYLIGNYFSKIFAQLQVKGIKLKLKGKISVSGNSRKRSILYRSGLTSHSATKLRVLHESTLISTFTGVLGFQLWLFY